MSTGSKFPSRKREREKQEKEAEPEMKEPATRKAKLEVPTVQAAAEDAKTLDSLVSLLSSSLLPEVSDAVKGIKEIFDRYEDKEVLGAALLQHFRNLSAIDAFSDSDDDSIDMYFSSNSMAKKR